MAANWVAHGQSQHMTILALLLRNTEVLVGLYHLFHQLLAGLESS